MRGNGEVTRSFGLICLEKICSRVSWEIFLAIERTTERVVSLKLTPNKDSCSSDCCQHIYFETKDIHPETKFYSAVGRNLRWKDLKP